MVLNAVLSVVGSLAGFAINPVWCECKNMLFYDSKIETLRDKVRCLEIKETEVQQSIVEAERNAETIKPVVTDWLKKVDDLKKQAYEVLESGTNSEMQCLFFICPNLKTRYSLGRKATKKTSEVVKLLEEGTLFQKVGDPKPLVQTPYQNPGDFGAFETRISIKTDIIEALKDKNVRIIGICGMGGVGKTTMAKEVAKEAEVNKLFHEFAWADVSQVPAVTKIQDQLAEKLGLKIKDTTDDKYVRDQRLHQRLEDGRRKSILVTLDDVWDDTVLETIGIPSPWDDIGLKIILTSRNKDVCERLRAQIFDIHHLNDEDSWELFQEKADISDDATDVVKDIAKTIAKECEGLPLALVTVGRALYKKAEDVWKNALEELRNPIEVNINGVQKLVYSRIKLSYNYLESTKAKSLLLLCSLFPENDISAEDLVRYAWGLGLFKDTTTLTTTRYKVKTIVDNLKSRYLLLSAEDEELVKLHDVVRDVCVQIASEEAAYMSKHIGLKEWPKHDNNESYSAISLISNELNQLPSGLEYPKLKFLGVECNQQSLNVSKEFFANMKELRVLDFTSMRIQIPSSIQSLTNLRTLCLDFCELNIEISTIGNLKKLEVLSFLGSDIDHFPNDIAELSNLMSLDLRLKHSSSHCPLSPGILLHLKRLEELYMGVIGIREEELEQRGYIINEISLLTRLNTLQISTNNPQFLLQMLKDRCIEELERFHIELTDLEYAHDHIMEYYYFRRRLHIRGITYASVLSQPAINSLMRRTYDLSIEMELNNLDDLSLQVMERKNMLDEDGFEYLNGNHPTGAFDGLQEIDLYGIPKMKHLFRGVIKLPSLHNLTTLTIESCPLLKSLFCESAALCMVNLQELRISHCEMLEEIISMNTEQNEVTQLLEFPKLREITLENLRNFKSFRCGSNKTVGVLGPQVTCPNLEFLCIMKLGCSVNIVDELRYLFSPSMANSLVALTDLWVEHCEGIEEIIGKQEEDYTSNTEIVEEGVTSRIVFPKLRNLTLLHLDRFRLLSSQNYLLVFPSLAYLRMEECPMMTKLCPKQLLSAPKLVKVRINKEQSIDISNFLDSEGSIQM